MQAHINILASRRVDRSRYDRAISLHNSALEIFTNLNDQWGIALAKNNLVFIYILFLVGINLF